MNTKLLSPKFLIFCAFLFFGLFMIMQAVIGDSFEEVSGSALPKKGRNLEIEPILPPGSLGDWAATTPLPGGALPYSKYVSNENFVYVLGGSSGGVATRTVRFAPFNSNGAIGSWSETTPLPIGLSQHGAIIYGEYLYVMGGDRVAPDVRFSKIDSSGSLGPWMIMDSDFDLGAQRDNFPVVGYNGYLFVIGGNVAGRDGGSVLHSQVNSADGSVGFWTPTLALPNSLSFHAAVLNNDYVYVIGGAKDSVDSSEVLYGRINQSGEIDSWTQTTPLPTPRSGHGAVVYNNRIYVIGGSSQSNGTNVIFAPILSDGGIGAWTNTTQLPSSRILSTPLVNKGRIYVLGDKNGLPDVIYSTVSGLVPVLN